MAGLGHEPEGGGGRSDGILGGGDRTQVTRLEGMEGSAEQGVQFGGLFAQQFGQVIGERGNFRPHGADLVGGPNVTLADFQERPPGASSGGSRGSIRPEGVQDHVHSPALGERAISSANSRVREFRTWVIRGAGTASHLGGLAVAIDLRTGAQGDLHGGQADRRRGGVDVRTRSPALRRANLVQGHIAAVRKAMGMVAASRIAQVGGFVPDADRGEATTWLAKGARGRLRPPAGPTWNWSMPGPTAVITSGAFAAEQPGMARGYMPRAFRTSQEVQAGDADLDFHFAAGGRRALDGGENQIVQHATLGDFEAERLSGGNLAAGLGLNGTPDQPGDETQAAAQADLLLAGGGGKLAAQRRHLFVGPGGVEVHAAAGQLRVLEGGRLGKAGQGRCAQPRRPTTLVIGEDSARHQPERGRLAHSRAGQALEKFEDAAVNGLLLGLEDTWREESSSALALRPARQMTPR